MIHVVNKHHGYRPDGHRNIYIGRGSPLGNPFSHRPNTLAIFRVPTREEAIRAYEHWLWNQIENNPSVVEALTHILDMHLSGEVNLICFCKPQACHGEVIKRIVESTANNITPSK